MIDFFLTLSVLMLIGSSILPWCIQVMIDSSAEREKYLATVLLYEKIQEGIVNNQIPPRQMIVKNDRQYEFIPDIDRQEACVQYEIQNHIKKEICEIIE